MPVDPELLEILVCPDDKSALRLVALPDALRTRLRDHYREQFKDEEPVVEDGLQCTSCGRVYPVVSDIPVMLIDDALPREEVGG